MKFKLFADKGDNQGTITVEFEGGLTAVESNLIDFLNACNLDEKYRIYDVTIVKMKNDTYKELGFDSD